MILTTWSLSGWEFPQAGEDPRVVIVAEEDDDDEAARRCFVVVHVLTEVLNGR
jgi:hypothetical protein